MGCGVRSVRGRERAGGRNARGEGAERQTETRAGPQSRRQPPTARTGARRPSPQLGSRSNLPPWSQGTACGGKGRREVRARPVRGCQSGSGQGQEVRQSKRDGARWRPRGATRATTPRPPRTSSAVSRPQPRRATSPRRRRRAARSARSRRRRATATGRSSSWRRTSTFPGSCSPRATPTSPPRTAHGPTSASCAATSGSGPWWGRSAATSRRCSAGSARGSPCELLMSPRSANGRQSGSKGVPRIDPTRRVISFP